MMDRKPLVATVLLTHEAPASVARMVAHWAAGDPEHKIAVAYGGTRVNFDRLENPDAVYVDDPFLRTRDHPRERQSYMGVFQAVLPVIRRWDATHVHVAEYDEIPLVSGMNERLLEVLTKERADVVGHRLEQVDDTGHPHYTFHCSDVNFRRYWESISVRRDHATVLSMLGCGSFWSREAFEAVASLEPPIRIYLELMLPTAAHHLGYRVRPISGHDRFMAPEVIKTSDDFDQFRKDGAWRIHPVKGFWSNPDRKS